MFTVVLFIIAKPIEIANHGLVKVNKQPGQRWRASGFRGAPSLADFKLPEEQGWAEKFVFTSLLPVQVHYSTPLAGSLIAGKRESD